MKMKFIFFFEFVFLFNTIKGDANSLLSVPREQELSEPLMMGKTIIISGKNGQINAEDPNVMQTVMNVVNNRFKSINNGKDINGNEIPEVIITDSDPQKGEGGASPLQSVQKVYNLPPMMRMIASQEETDNKKSSLWRSPIPFLHSEECPHKHHKKSKSGRRKARKHQKEKVPSTTTTTTPTTTVKPVVEENREPLNSLLSSILSNAVFPSAPEFGSHLDGMRPPTSFSMSISHRIHPSHSELMDVPMLSEHKPRAFIAILHKSRALPLAAPQSLPLPLPLSLAAPQPEPQFMGPTGPHIPSFNPFLALLSKLEEPVEPNMNHNFNTETEPKESNEDKGRVANYNFNVNLTVNNYNYGQSKDSVRPPFPLIFN